MADAQVESIANRYRSGSVLGEGGMGVVYRAYDRLTGRDVALKSIAVDPSALAYNSRATNRDYHLSLAREFRILASLRHPHIIDVLDYGFDHQPFFTMVLIENARTFTEACHAATRPEKLHLLRQLLQAMQYLHRRGIIHRDLKPHNILVTEEGTVQVVDFGLAIEHGARQKMAGTIFYVAPEILQGHPATYASDLYSLGMIALESLTGRYPLAYADEEALVRRILVDEIDVTDTDIPLNLQAFLSRMLHKDPNQRTVDLQTMIDDLQDETALAIENVAVQESYISAARFVGREDELRELQLALRQIRSRRGASGMWLVRGEAGVGKSRLVDELRIRASVQPDVLVLEGVAAEDGGLPFQMWRSVVSKLLLHSEVNSLQAGVLKDVVSNIDRLLQRPVEDAPPIAGRAYWQRLSNTLLQLFQQQQMTMLLILEDLQWASESLKLLQHLRMYMDDLPGLMILGTFREEAAEEVEGALPGAHILPLSRLSEQEVTELSGSILGMTGQQEQILDLLNRETEGNTFFIVEVIRDLAESSGGLQLIGSKTLPGSIFTGGMYDLLVRRMARIPKAYLPISRTAAVMGRLIDTDILHHLFPRRQVQDWLYLCNASSILTVDEQTWWFSHDKIRESILLDTPENEQPRIHRQVATAIEHIYPGSSDYDRVLVMHWQAAGDVERLMTYLIPVTRRMVEITDEHETAQQWLHDGLAILPDDDPRRVTLLILLAISYDRTGRLDVGEMAVREAIPRAVAAEDRPSQLLAISVLGLLLIRLGRFAEAEEFLAAAVELAAQVDAPMETARAHNHIGLGYVYRGQSHQAIHHYQQSIAVYQRIDEEWGAAMTLNNLGMEYARLRDYNRSLSTLQQGYTIRERAGDQWGMASSLNNIGLVATWNGDYQGARDYLQRSLAIYRSIGAKRDIANALANLSFVELHLNAAGVKALLDEGIRLAYEVGSTPIVLELLAGYAWYMFRQGRVLRAGRLVAMITEHPTFNIEVQEKLDEWLPQMQQDLTPTQKTMIASLSLDFDTTLKAIIED
ncbi:MAG: protein kinase [Chloroflexota bacterium]